MDEMKCRECGAEMAAGTTNCPQCGAQAGNDAAPSAEAVETEKTGWKAKVIGFFKKAVQSMKADFQAGGIKKLARNKYFIGACVLLVFFIASGTQEEPEKRQAAPTASSEPQKQVAASRPQATPSKSAVEPSGVDFFTIRNNQQTMTELQFKEYVKSLKGEKIRWTGYVEEIEEAWTGGYKILIDMDSPYEQFSVQDITFKIPKDRALALRKDQQVTFTGTIKNVISVLNSLSVDLDDPKIIS